MLTYRDEKGEDLSPEEVDGNFRDLAGRTLLFQELVADNTGTQTAFASTGGVPIIEVWIAGRKSKLGEYTLNAAKTIATFLEAPLAGSEISLLVGSALSATPVGAGSGNSPEKFVYNGNRTITLPDAITTKIVTVNVIGDASGNVILDANVTWTQGGNTFTIENTKADGTTVQPLTIGDAIFAWWR